MDGKPTETSQVKGITDTNVDITGGLEGILNKHKKIEHGNGKLGNDITVP